jgi:hypothetical protein
MFLASAMGVGCVFLRPDVIPGDLSFLLFPLLSLFLSCLGLLVLQDSLLIWFCWVLGCGGAPSPAFIDGYMDGWMDGTWGNE